MTETETWVQVLEGWYITLNGDNWRTYPPGDVFLTSSDQAAEYVSKGWVVIVDAPEPALVPDYSGWVAARVLSELHLDGGRSYAEGEIVDLSPSEAERYLALGAISLDA